MNTSLRKFDARVTFYLVAMATVVVLLLISSFSFSQSLQLDLRDQIRQELAASTRRADTFLSASFSAAQDKLEALAAVCDLPDGSGEENFWEVLRRYDTEEHRMVVFSLDGAAYYGDHQKSSVSAQPYFAAIRQGEAYLSGVLPGSFEGRDSVLLTVPLYDGDGRTAGALGIEYSTLYLGSLLNAEQGIEGAGATLMLDKEGRVTASYTGMEAYDTFYQMLDTMDLQEGVSVGAVRAAAEQGQAAFYQYSGAGFNHTDRFLYIQPSQIQGWTVATIVVSSFYKNTLQQIGRRSSEILIVYGCCFALLVLLGWRVQVLRHRYAEERRKDPLTGVYTRAAAQRLIQRSLRKDKEFPFTACVFLDVDHFKTINDTRGHDAGDRILVQVAETLTMNVRRSDIVSRYGGDEFNLWLRVADETALKNICADLLAVFRASAEVTVSLGGTMLAKGESLDSALRRADEALYTAKQHGRDRYYLL